MKAEKTYDSFSSYYDAYVGGFRDDLPLYWAVCEGETAILEVGCGTGRVLDALLQKGLSVTGLDISPAMLSIAEKKFSKYLAAGKLKLVKHDLIAAPPAGRYSVVLVTFYTVNYLLDEPDLSGFLRNIRDAMQNNGRIVFDCFYPKALAKPETNDIWEKSILHYGGESITVEQKKKMLDAIEERIQIFEKGADRRKVVTLRRYYDKTAMIKALAEVGFGSIRIADGYEYSNFHGLGPEENTRSNFVVEAKKNE